MSSFRRPASEVAVAACIVLMLCPTVRAAETTATELALALQRKLDGIKDFTIVPNSSAEAGQRVTYKFDGKFYRAK